MTTLIGWLDKSKQYRFIPRYIKTNIDPKRDILWIFKVEQRHIDNLKSVCDFEIHLMCITRHTNVYRMNEIDKFKNELSEEYFIELERFLFTCI